jgi:predicted acylesterase/phospholipase RssA
MADSVAIRRGEEILASGAAVPAELLGLAKQLEHERALTLARRLLELGYDRPEVRSNLDLRGVFGKRFALLTYKDSELPVEKALNDAFTVLRQSFDLAKTQDQEVLGLAGAIWKRRFDMSAQKRDLERSAAHYTRGSEQGAAWDQGYTGINAAFVLDLLADLEETDARTAGQEAPAAQDRRQQAHRIREDILANVPEPVEGDEAADRDRCYWTLVTLAEAHFGIGEFDEAQRLLTRAAPVNVPDWYRETTARQIASLSRVAAGRSEQSEQAARATLDTLVGGNADAVAAAFTGKIGLALSGGGFRAALFHIGVLARLAECDLLRRVEYFSCVSGGSIIGTHFYLELRKLLAEKPDDVITRDDYITIVQKVERDFLDGVQRNIRTRVAAEWLTNLKMIILPNYSRTIRVGELYERELFARVEDGLGHQKRWLDDLRIDPYGSTPGSFNPKTDNWRRVAKVPILVINATALNTGHNWQFTASWMGEPPANVESEIDANYRLRRMYHRQAPQKAGRVRLGHAVAASSCVPGLFEPLPLEMLYLGKVVRLVDGGVHDNQGTAALLEQNCSLLIVSDASGQMNTDDDPTSGLLGVPLRANSILQSRVRVAQFRELEARRRAGLLRGLVFLHLKKGLEADNVDWIDCQDPTPPQRRSPLTPYRVQKHVQRRLAAIRTDLDSFSDTEAYSLMVSAYRMMDEALQSGALGIPVTVNQHAEWRFLAAGNAVVDPNENSHLMRQLGVAHQIGFKIWRLSRQLQLSLSVAVLIVLGSLFYSWAQWSGFRIPTLTLGELLVMLVLLAGAKFGLPLLRRWHFRKTLQEILIGVGMATVGFLGARVHLHFFDKLFLWQGRLRQRATGSAGIAPGSPRTQMDQPPNAGGAVTESHAAVMHQN